HARVFERAAHKVRVGDRRAVVAEGDSACLRELGKVGQLTSCAAAGHARYRKYSDGAVRLSGPKDEPDRTGRIDGWLGVRHRADGREAAASGRQGAGRDCRLVLEARLAQVRVDVAETGAAA